MPRFSALEALERLRELGVDLPVLIVSGTIGEETAVAALQAGANDFLLKDRLSRLVPAVERELRDARAQEAKRHAEAALKRSEARFRRLADSGIIGIVVADRSGVLTEANDAFLRIVGYTSEDLHGSLAFERLIAPEWVAASANAKLAVDKTGVAAPFETELIGKSGARVPVLMAVASIEEPYRMVVTVDLSERKRLESQLRRVQKLDAIGSLAGGIAHDFNNLLSVILSCTTLALQDLQPGTPATDELGEVANAARRASELTRQLLAFSRQQMLEPKILDLNRVVSGIEKLLRRVVGEDIDLSIHTEPRLGNVRADPGQLEQVLMNLVVNARDAMPKGGKLTIETQDVDLERARAGGLGIREGAYVLLTVSDTGVGMDAATRERIFEPFFTTKDRGRGTGLGLATVFGIVQQTGGHVFVSSEPGRGSTFEVYLPRHLGAATETAPPQSPAKSTGSETILVVEDDEHVRRVTRAILKRGGYTVLEAQNGGEALLLCEKHEGTIHLLVTDVIMPRMSGRELAERLAKIRAEMKVLYVSGYAADVVEPGPHGQASAFLQKPTTPEGLLGKVREVLDTE